MRKALLVLIVFVFHVPLAMTCDWNDRDDIGKESEEVAQEVTTQLTPSPETAPVVDANIFVGKDRGTEYIIKMADKLDKAKPAFRIPLTEEFPGWVNEEGKELEVVISFVVDPEGIVSYLHIDESSGYRNLDNAIVKTFRKWKFSNPTGKDRILGTLTYRIKPNDGN